MNCESGRQWLLEASAAEILDAPAALADHLAACPACRKLADDIINLEQTWREQPIKIPAPPTPWLAPAYPAQTLDSRLRGNANTGHPYIHAITID
jgi:predicted anti-sigma-YlaC factor YlaD